MKIKMYPFSPLTPWSHSWSLKGFNRKITDQKTEYLNTVDATSCGCLILGVDAILFSAQLQL